MDSRDVTLVVPCYNAEDTLPAALRAIDRLNPGPKTVLCVDDGSTDGTNAILESHDGVRLLEHETNEGLGKTLNLALARTETPLFAKVDADIVVPPDWLARIIEAYDEHEAALIQGRFVERETTVADRWRSAYPSPMFDQPPERNKPLNGSNILADTEALRAIGGYDEQYRRAFDDIDLMERLMEAGYDIYYEPSVGTTHIRTDTWREVLRTEWAYQNDPRYRGKPARPADVVRRLPFHSYRSLRCVYNDLRAWEFGRLWISVLRLPYLVKGDIEHVLLEDNSQQSDNDIRS